MRSNAYTNAYEMMFVMSKGKPATFNALKEPTKRHGYECLTHNKLPDGVNKKKLGELKKEKTRTNIWPTRLAWEARLGTRSPSSIPPYSQRSSRLTT